MFNIYRELKSGDADFLQQVKAVGVLCGHAAPITDLALCRPIASEENCYVSSRSNFSALISACCDGFLCVWSKSSGHCRCRRKLPPWVGTPRVIRTLPSTPRYVCIACSFVDGNEDIGDRETRHRKPPKCTILIVDTYSLSITQTVFHGNLSIGPIKFMALVFVDDDDGKRHSVFVADSSGKQQVVSISGDPHDRGESLTSPHKDKFQLESSFCAEGFGGVDQVVSVATFGNIVAFMLKSKCIFRSLSGDTTIGEVSFVDNLFCSDGHSTQAHAIDGIFLQSDDVGNMPDTCECDDNLIPVHFVVWNSRGYAIIYKISYQNDVFQCEPHSEIPASHYQPDTRLSIFFLQVNQYLVCIKSVCFHHEEPLLWRPHITIWSLHHFDEKPGKLCRQCRMISDGVSSTDCFEKSTQLERPDDLETKSTFGASPSSDDIGNKHEDSIRNYYAYKGQIVSSSMIISENLFTPHAVVYGFLSGEIEVVRFELFQGIRLGDASSNPDEKSTAYKQNFSGHTGAVLCLAAHQMMGSAKSYTPKRVLVSGSTDCTIRVWDLDTGSLIKVMHHHVAAVHQIILPPSLTGHPWSDCFLSVGEDACVALVSLETLQVERMFPGHINYPSKVLWDGARGYIVCLCQTHHGNCDGDVLYIWDVKAGSRERVLRGTAAHSMLDHFCKSISMNSASGSVLNGNTSVSSLLLPIVDDARFSNSALSLSENLLTSSNSSPSISSMTELNSSKTNAGKGNSAKPNPSSTFGLLSNNLPIKCSCPFPGIVSLSFDLASLMFSFQKNESMENGDGKPVSINLKQKVVQEQNPSHHNPETLEGHDWVSLFEEYLIRYSLSFLHLWSVDSELDNLLINDMKLRRPENFIVASGLQGDKGSLTLLFPCQSATLEVIWIVCWDLFSFVSFQ